MCGQKGMHRRGVVKEREREAQNTLLPALLLVAGHLGCQGLYRCPELFGQGFLLPHLNLIGEGLFVLLALLELWRGLGDALTVTVAAMIHDPCIAV
jgi:hypothetical protein